MLKTYDFKFLSRNFVYEAEHIPRAGNVQSAHKTRVLCVLQLRDFCSTTTSRLVDLRVLVVDKNNSAKAGSALYVTPQRVPSWFCHIYVAMEENVVAAAKYVKFCALNYEIDSTNPICLRQNSPVSFFDTGEKTRRSLDILVRGCYVGQGRFS